jgi:hypothetical protein
MLVRLSKHSADIESNSTTKSRHRVQASAVGIAPIAPQMLQGMEVGWTQSLERLGELLAKV